MQKLSSTDVDRSTGVWSGHVLSLRYEEIALGQQFKDLLHYFGYVGVAVNLMVTTNQCNTKARGLMVF